MDDKLKFNLNYWKAVDPPGRRGVVPWFKLPPSSAPSLGRVSFNLTPFTECNHGADKFIIGIERRKQMEWISRPGIGFLKMLTGADVAGAAVSEPLENEIKIQLGRFFSRFFFGRGTEPETTRKKGGRNGNSKTEQEEENQKKIRRGTWRSGQGRWRVENSQNKWITGQKEWSK